MTPYYQDEDCTIWHGDCREILPALPRVDAVATDPPYGVKFSGKSGHYRNSPSAKRLDTYASYDDSPENFQAVIIPALKAAIEIAGSAVVFMASRNVFLLPQGDLGGIFLPNGCGLSSWGFQNFMHAVFYGKDPYLKAGLGCYPNGKYGLYGNDSNRIDHPCAKPVAAMLWAVNRVSLPDQLVLDPFMGSGTTLVAAKRLGRKAIGIEIEERYCEIAAERLRREEKPLFAALDTEPNQGMLLEWNAAIDHDPETENGASHRSDNWLRGLGAQDAIREELLEMEDRP